jgi:hypothetical protein
MLFQLNLLGSNTVNMAVKIPARSYSVQRIPCIISMVRSEIIENDKEVDLGSFSKVC